MRDHHRILTKAILTLVPITHLLLAEAAYAADGAADADAAAADVGKTVGKPISTGFVFYKGRYIEAPYRFTRRGFKLFVNDKLIEERKPIPAPVIPKEDPGAPRGLTEKSTLGELLGNEHADKKYRYICATFPRKVAKEKMAEYYRSLPCVKSAPWMINDVAGVLSVTMVNGTEVNIDINPPCEDSYASTGRTPQQSVAILEKSRERHESLLKTGAVLYLYRSWSTGMTGKQAARDLALVVDILRSDRQPEVKLDLLKRLGFLLGHADKDSPYFRIITDFEASKQLDKRIKAMQRASGITPRTYGDIPAMSAQQRYSQWLDRQVEQQKQREKAAEKKGPE